MRVSLCQNMKLENDREYRFTGAWMRRYEATCYASASLERLAEIAKALGVQIKAEVVFG